MRLACADDDALGQVLEVYWDYETDRRILRDDRWANVATNGSDAPWHFFAFLQTIRWNCVTSTDSNLHSRETRQVYDELVANAQRSLLISTYAYFQGQVAFKSLAEQMDSLPELKVTLLLNIDRGRHSTTESNALVRGFAERFWESDWPGQARPSIYYDPRSLEPGGPKGVLHAKAVIADEESLFVTSANWTEAALDRNVEVGVLLRDRTLALTALAHFRALID